MDELELETQHVEMIWVNNLMKIVNMEIQGWNRRGVLLTFAKTTWKIFKGKIGSAIKRQLIPSTPHHRTADIRQTNFEAAIKI